MCNPISSPFAARPFVQSSIAFALNDVTELVVHTRGFHMTVIGIFSASAIAAVLPIVSAGAASPSKSSVQTTYSGNEALKSRWPTASSCPL